MKISLRRSCLRRLLCIALAVMLTAGFIPVHTEAATAKLNVITLKSEKTTTVREGYCYKIKVPANGYIKIKTNTTNHFFIYNSYKKIGVNNVDSLGYTKIHYRVLPKGTYYILGPKGAKFNWSFIKTKTPANYCRFKASPLKKGKKITIVFNHNYEFARFYKIKLTSKKAITIKQKGLDSDIGRFYNELELLDSKGCSVGFLNSNTSPEDKEKRTRTLPAGTYYIVVDTSSHGYNGSSERMNHVCQIYWK